MSESIRTESAVKSPSDLPPPRDRKGIRPVSPPLSNLTPLQLLYRVICRSCDCILRLAFALMEVGGWRVVEPRARQAPSRRGCCCQRRKYQPYPDRGTLLQRCDRGG
ncbi:hypothetical protein BD413DRAFT_578597 [Trametes elegans]|nr:hypothetical protein BD413DRAFT_578597 [Trametes elegans]